MLLPAIPLLCLGLGLVQGTKAQTGSPSRVSLSAHPHPVVKPGGEVIFWCRRPPGLYDWLVTFSLLKVGGPKPLEKKELQFSQANFSLKCLNVQDSGNYSCNYYETTDSNVTLESSETLEIWVTDSLPKPSLSARPSSKVTSGDNVTLLCQGPSRGVEFALYKDGEEMPVSTREPSQHGAEFPLIHININQTGKYRCCYLLGRQSPVLAPPSDPLELIIQEEQNESLLTRENKTILITALSCASILFLFFTFRSHCHTQNVISHGETSRRFPRCLSCTWLVCFSSKSGAPQDETEYARVAKCRHSRTSVSYSHLPLGGDPVSSWVSASSLPFHSPPPQPLIFGFIHF
ncbi:T-cell-interacting, activating receptor on myeloid cells protein 1-like isoform X2 [Sminthopsis crassicaudata]|uniref:T-cell-interacting, activating receptor on myeloid cells protein 1-like isoform X2 n=1 Tax=Sminthopsis crassicaudata TaxID=9301 RepID=UPI003D687AC0